MTDELTQLPNRRAAELRISEHLRVARETGHRVGILVCDLDHFKNVNDTFGHEIGDAVLRVAAGTLRAAVRDVDFAARWGGEEFVVVVGGATHHSLEQLAARCRMLVAESAIPVNDSERIGVTVSIGGTLSKPDDTIATLVRRADECLYAAKRAGRNRATIEFGDAAGA